MCHHVLTNRTYVPPYVNQQVLRATKCNNETFLCDFSTGNIFFSCKTLVWIFSPLNHCSNDISWSCWLQVCRSVVGWRSVVGCRSAGLLELLAARLSNEIMPSQRHKKNLGNDNISIFNSITWHVKSSFCHDDKCINKSNRLKWLQIKLRG